MNRDVAGIKPILCGGYVSKIPKYKENKVAVSSGSDYTEKQVCNGHINIFRRSIIDCKHDQSL